ncbi:MAG TPA: CHAD domain-containing protein [Conexibacter sp.]|nr:CHAD domain-containing protein [Conexibacter sp.]
MAYRLSIADDVPSSVRACAREQLQGAIARLEQTHGDPVDAIHDARKQLKKTRALLRLVRPAIGARAHRRENAALRDAGLALSDARDADVLLETVDKLAAHAAGRLPAATFVELRAALEAEREPGSVDRAAVAATLREARTRVAEWPLLDADWDAVLAGVGRVYERGRDAFADAREDPSVVRLHEWRKRVKDLWYHERLLAPAWPLVIGAHGEQAHLLSELLGDDHDLAMLHGRLEARLALGPEAGADLPALLGLVAERRAELRAAAFALGLRLYAESPKAFTRRLGHYVHTARAAQRDGPSA